MDSNLRSKKEYRDWSPEELQSIESLSSILNNFSNGILEDVDIEDLQEYLSNPSESAYLKLLYNIPSGFKLTARVTTNYRCLLNIYAQRYNHRLPEWQDFCKQLLDLPYFKEFVENYV